MKEVVYEIEDFKRRVDLSKPIHYDGWRDSLDDHGVFYKLTFRIYGISKDGGHILIYESQARVSTLDIPKEYLKTGNALSDLNLWCKDIFERYAEEKAKPLNATPGRWEE